MAFKVRFPNVICSTCMQPVPIGTLVNFAADGTPGRVRHVECPAPEGYDIGGNGRPWDGPIPEGAKGAGNAPGNTPGGEAPGDQPGGESPMPDDDGGDPYPGQPQPDGRPDTPERPFELEHGPGDDDCPLCKLERDLARQRGEGPQPDDPEDMDFAPPGENGPEGEPDDDPMNGDNGNGGEGDQPDPDPEEDAPPMNPNDPNAILAKMLWPYLKKPVQGEIDNSLEIFTPPGDNQPPDAGAVIEIVRAEIDARVKAEVERLNAPLRIELKKADKIYIPDGLYHKQFPRLLNKLQQGQVVLVVGPPGGGKTEAIRQAAHLVFQDDADVTEPFHYMQLAPQSMPSSVIGSTDANGNFLETPYYRGFTRGGLVVLDEIDNTNDGILTATNGASANGIMTFGDKKTYQKHPKFLLAYLGNTNGRGGSQAFPNRRPLDAATLDRAYYIEWEYDEALEMAICRAINPNVAEVWVPYVQRIRAYCADKYPRLFITPRASINGTKDISASKDPIRDIAEAVIFKGFDPSVVKSIMNEHPLPKKQDFKEKGA